MIRKTMLALAATVALGAAALAPTAASAKYLGGGHGFHFSLELIFRAGSRPKVIEPVKSKPERTRW